MNSKEMGFYNLVLQYEDRKKEIGKRIQALRIAKGLKQAEFLRALYMSDTSLKSLRSWEKGEILPELDTLTRMATVFECDIGYLLCDYDEINRDIADICTATGFTASAAQNIENMDFVVGNRHFAQFENGTLSKRYILSQAIADERIIQVLIAAKQAKSLKFNLQKKVDPDIDSEDFSQALFTLDEMSMVALRPEDSVNFYIQEAGRIFMDILRSVVDNVSDDESYSTDLIPYDSKVAIKRVGPEAWQVDEETGKMLLPDEHIIGSETVTKPTPAP